LAKALGRIGSAYLKKSDVSSAIKYIEKSLTEHRTPEILAKLREAERAKQEADRLAYLDPAKSAVAREEGNAQFKRGEFAEAVKTYSEAIKRDPKDPRGYNNRAAAYQKLVALPEALKDAEEAIKIDPTFGGVSLFILFYFIDFCPSQGLHSQVERAVWNARVHEGARGGRGRGGARRGAQAQGGDTAAGAQVSTGALHPARGRDGGGDDQQGDA
jgi:tetratricopeptide (TPR) repeat protein